MGIDRIGMLKYGIPDLRAFFDSDLRWLRHYGFSALECADGSRGDDELSTLNSFRQFLISRCRLIGLPEWPMTPARTPNGVQQCAWGGSRMQKNRSTSFIAPPAAGRSFVKSIGKGCLMPEKALENSNLTTLSALGLAPE
jgi:hypothetical protein